MEKIKTKRLLVISLLLLSACIQPGDKKKVGLTDDGKTRLLSVVQMQGDLSILWAAIQAMHPAYGIYTPADSLQIVYNQVNASLDSSLPEDDFITHIYPLICALRCGHTQIRHSAGYQPSHRKVPALPFHVLVQNHRVWVTAHETAALTTGDEILSVNQVAAVTLVTQGYNMYAGDGYNETFKELYLSEYDGFEDVLNMDYHWRPPYSITISTKQGVLKTVQIDSASAIVSPSGPATTENIYPKWVKATGADPLPLWFLKNTCTAWLKVGSYQYEDTLLFKEAFTTIREKGVKNLVIDLRHNTGGDIRIAAKLLSYLADAPYHIIGDVQSRIPNPAVNGFEKYFDTARTNSFIMGFSTGAKEGSWYHVGFKPVFGDMLATLPLDKTAQYTGNLYVLIDGATFSAGAHTAIAIQCQCKKAVFIGRETAGGAEGCSGGTIQHLTLPNTGIVVEFPWMRFVSVAPYARLGHGIMPGYPIAYSAEDIVANRDLDMEKALSLIR